MPTLSLALLTAALTALKLKVGGRDFTMVRL